MFLRYIWRALPNSFGKFFCKVSHCEPLYQEVLRLNFETLTMMLKLESDYVKKFDAIEDLEGERAARLKTGIYLKKSDQDDR